MDKIAVIIAALAVIGLIIWWFFSKRTVSVVPATRQGDKQIIEITVNGGYSPNVIELEKGVPADLIFTRKDPSACFEEVVLPDFGIRTKLPINAPYTVSIDPKETGEYKYACGMNMFFGKVIVK